MLRSISQALPIRASLAVFLLLGIAVVAAQTRLPATPAMIGAASPVLEPQEATELLFLRAASMARGFFVDSERL